MVEEKKTENILIRLTPKEKQNIQKKAEEKKTTVTALILKSIENNITVNLDTSDYRDLVIQTRRIGSNVNALLRRIHTYEFYEDTDIRTIEQSLKEIERLIEEERKTIHETKKEFENLTPRKVKRMFENMDKEVPLYLIYDEIVNHINEQMLLFIDLMKEQDFDSSYIPFIEFFLERFIPTDYEYDELVEFSNDLDKLFYDIDRKVLIETGKINEEDFMDVMNVLNEHRKDFD